MHKYTFFEEAQQQGYVVALMGDRMQRSRDFAKIVTLDDQRTRVFVMYKTMNPEVPVFQFVIPERTSLESQSLWRDRCKLLLDKAWKAYKEERKAAREAALALSTAPTAGSSGSPPSNPIASSTEAQTRLRSLTLAQMEADDALMGYGNGPSDPKSSETIPDSLAALEPLLQRSASKYPSLLTGSTDGGGSDTAPPASTRLNGSGSKPSQPSSPSTESGPPDSSKPKNSPPRRRYSKPSAPSAK